MDDEGQTGGEDGGRRDRREDGAVQSDTEQKKRDGSVRSIHMNMNFMTTEKTLCWDCANAMGTCSWSKKMIPVEGWEAIPTEKQQFRGEPLKSFLVTKCPEFKRDAWNGGQKWLDEERNAKVVELRGNI